MGQPIDDLNVTHFGIPKIKNGSRVRIGGGEFVEELADVAYHWAGSTNQRVIDVQKSLRTGTVILKGE